MNYREAGVDIETGDAFVRSITPLAKATAIPGVMGGLGGFGALFDLKPLGYRDPILVAATDGVGTKLKIAIAVGKHDTIGIDLVAMCVNDLVVHGAAPLFFLDYFATAKLDPEVALAVVQGIARGCRAVGCALIGGETAEMPGLYRSGEYDLAGFAVGAVERAAQLPADVAAGDVILGLPSAGVHSNGLSLVRHIVEREGLAWNAPFDPERTLGEAFLTPTRLYVNDILGLGPHLHAAAHITGGGLIGNIPRVIPEGLTIKIRQPWPVPAEFRWIKCHGGATNEDMLRTFNCGIGMVLIASEQEATSMLAASDAIYLGEVVAGDTPEINLPDDNWWR